MSEVHDEHRVRVSSRHAVTLPRELRDELGIAAGDELTWEVTPEGALLLVPPGVERPDTADADRGEPARRPADVFDRAGEDFDPDRHLRDTARIAEAVWSNAS